MKLPSWWHERVAVVGDAGFLTPSFGDGSTLAMAGAYTLACELARWAESTQLLPADAFGRYERAHRVVVAPKPNGYRLGRAVLLPRTRPGIVTRNTIARAAPRLSAVPSRRQ